MGRSGYLARLVFGGIRKGTARFVCAAAGVAAACGAVVFMFSLAETNAAQANARAARLLREVPVEKGARAAALSLDYRPGGRVMQGPPMRVTAVRTRASGVTVTRALFAQRRLRAPAAGTDLVLVGAQGTYTVKITRVLDWEIPVRGYPNVFLGPDAARALARETWRPLPEASVETLAPRLRSDEEKRMDYARPLLFAAAALTALCLLVNSLLLSVEANRRALAVLRTVGMGAGGVCALVAWESACMALAGWLAGTAGAAGALRAYVRAHADLFPAGAAFDWAAAGVTLACALAVACAAALFALRPALRVRPLDARAETARPRRRRGMAVAFACAFGAFVAVEVWGASLMRAFVPSPEWPDAIVSLLPEGVSAFDIEKLRALPGVKRVSELLPLQLDFDPVEPMEAPKGRAGGGGPGPGGGRPQNRNALFLAAEWLPRFRFLEGTWEEADAALRAGDACVITEMMSRARGLHKGDRLRVRLPGRGAAQAAELPVAGVVDLNWHMVTSRGLVRGLRGAPVMTDGAVFVSFDTLESLDARPAAHVRMTHVWLDYDEAFLKEKGVFGAGRATERAVARALGFDPLNAENAVTVRLHARDEIADGTLAHGSDLIGQTARVPYVFLAILSIGFIAMLAADADRSRAEFRALRAVGATRGHVARRLAAGALRAAAWGIAWGVPCGALTGWLFSLKTGNWPGLPHYFVVPWRIVAEGAAGAVCVALLVAAPTAACLVFNRKGNNET